MTPSTVVVPGWGGKTFRAVRDQRGFVLPLTLIIVMLLTTLVASLLAQAVTEPLIAANATREAQALGLAEAGAENAIAQFVFNPAPVDCAMATAADGCATPTPTAATTLFAAQPFAGMGTYTVTYQPIAFLTLLITSQGQTTLGGGQRTVRVIVTRQLTSKFAILADIVQIGSAAKINGALGAIQGNTAMQLSGTTWVAQTATTAATSCSGCTSPTNVGNPGGSGPNKPAQTLPVFNPGDYQGKADFVLRGDGNVLIVATGVLVPQNTGTFVGWTMGGAGQWTFSGITTPPNGTYYASNSITISSSPGSATVPWQATFISGTTQQTGTVDIEGSPTIVPALGGLLILSGQVSLEAVSRGTATVSGTIVATAPCVGCTVGEVQFDGSINFTGNLISDGEVQIGDNASLTYNSLARIRILRGPLQVLSWRTTSP